MLEDEIKKSIKNRKNNSNQLRFLFLFRNINIMDRVMTILIDFQFKLSCAAILTNQSNSIASWDL